MVVGAVDEVSGVDVEAASEFKQDVNGRSGPSGRRRKGEEVTRRGRQFTDALRGALLAELARTSLMAFTLCQLHVADPEHPLPDGRMAVYTEFTDLIYENTSNGAGRE
ncbi:hypothetical protein ACFY0A_44520 [Streptomyces sp. NPDC001698]|uniref:hypothetical protein n=1 Tax=unclassified Streptomyces TaxID=2593676 RepID=UPI0036C2C115